MTETFRNPQEEPVAKACPEKKLDFGEFSKIVEYVDVNRCLIEKLVSKLPNNFVHIDVATGTGMVPKLIKEIAEKMGKKGKVIGVDPNPTSLTIAKEEVLSSENVYIKFIEGKGQNLKELLKGEIPEEGVDSVSIHDALHEIRNNEHKTQVIQSMTDILKPEGCLTFNSAFTTISNSHEGSGGKWGRWKLTAMKKLGLRGRKEQSEEEKVKHPDAIMPILSPEQYKAMIEKAGLVIIDERKIPVRLTKEALMAISKYPAFFEGTFDDIQGEENIQPVEKKSEALIQAMEELGYPELPKVWYEIIAQKPASGSTPNTAQDLNHL